MPPPAAQTVANEAAAAEKGRRSQLEVARARYKQANEKLAELQATAIAFRAAVNSTRMGPMKDKRERMASDAEMKVLKAQQILTQPARH